ncbi:uncharacterized protein LOC117337125 isoform X2 [Pecten maximus]|uniref:uncharacterized protein LOC117337125 isoform X2 n=1 Tax=Pecten maximus TaxID=6579 RepID=UPI0014590D7A|nr:uncharacterized protein LOC117337125 isoform X2 [Pecten maximus]
MAEGISEGETLKQCGTKEEIAEGATLKPWGTKEKIPEGATSKQCKTDEAVPEGATAEQCRTHEAVPEGATSEQCRTNEAVPEGTTSEQCRTHEAVPEGATSEQCRTHEAVPEGAISEQCRTHEAVPEGATSEQCRTHEAVPEGTTSEQCRTHEAVSEGATSEQCRTHEAVPEGATSKLCEMHEELLEGATCNREAEHQSMLRWTKDLIEQPSKEIIKLMKEDPGLISKRITIECSQDGCTCSNSFERLEFHAASSRKNTLHHIKTLIERGHCPHMFVDTVSSHKDLNQSKTTTDKTVRSETTNNIARSKQSENEQCADTVLAGITAVHIASIFGKVKIVEYIAHALQERIRSPYIIECEEMFTSVHEYDPYYLSVFHRQDQTLGLLRSYITHPMAWTEVYKKVLHNSIQLAVLNDNVRALKILIPPPHSRNEYDMHCALLLAIKNHCMKSLKWLCKEGALLAPSAFAGLSLPCSCRIRKDEVIKGIFLKEDNMVVEELFRHGGFRYRRMLLHYAVFYDNTVVTAFILENYKKMLPKKKSYFEGRKMIPVTIQAVLNNSTNILEVLLRSEHIAAGEMYKHYIALDWARALHFDQCVVLLENDRVPHDSDATEKYPPLVEVFGENINSFYYSKSVLVLRLLQNGNDVNGESVNGKTALYAALESKTYSLVRQLLMDGADPFCGRNCLTSFLSLRLLGELLYANVDIFERRTGVSLVHQLLFSFPKLHCHLVFLLKHAHTIPKPDLKLLHSLHDSNIVSRDILEQINNYLETPKSLVLRSRDIIRSHFGYKIHDFVRICNLPTQIKSILTLDGILDYFMSLPFSD